MNDNKVECTASRRTGLRIVEIFDSRVVSSDSQLSESNGSVVHLD